MRAASQIVRCEIAGVSDRGCVRAENQDAWYADATAGIVVVADGMGGGPAGAEASRTVAERLPLLIRERLRDSGPDALPRRRVARRLLRDSILSMGQEMVRGSAEDPERKGMGATVVAAWRCGAVLHVAHQGDSRAYLFRKGGLRKLTADHSIVAMLVRDGEITIEEAAGHPARGQLTRFVGMPWDAYCEVQSMGINGGDRLLLCTDGLWGVVAEEEMAATLSECSGPEQACCGLIDAALRRGAPDNVTAVVWDLGGVR